MVHYLYHSHNDILVIIDATDDNISSDVTIRVFGLMLLGLEESRKKEFIDDIDALNELREEFWVVPGRSKWVIALWTGNTKKDTPTDLETSDQLAERRCREIAKKWSLAYVTD